MEERQAVGEEKRLNRSNSLKSMQEEVEVLKERLSVEKASQYVWCKILGLIIHPDTHGSNKARDLPWITYFEQVCGESIQDVPMAFQVPSSELSFEEVVVRVSTQISDVKKEVDKREKMLKNKEDRLASLQSRQERDEARMQRKVEKVVREKESGQEIAAIEMRKTLDGRKVWFT